MAHCEILACAYVDLSIFLARAKRCVPLRHYPVNIPVILCLHTCTPIIEDVVGHTQRKRKRKRKNVCISWKFTPFGKYLDDGYLNNRHARAHEHEHALTHSHTHTHTHAHTYAHMHTRTRTRSYLHLLSCSSTDSCSRKCSSSLHSIPSRQNTTLACK